MASGARGTYNHREVVDWVRQYFLDEPSTSIDDCCRDAHTLRIAVSRDLISSVRRGLKVLGPPAEVKPVLSVVRQQPQYFADKPPPVDLFKQIHVEAPREEKDPGERYVSIEIRRGYYDDLLLANPHIKINTAMRKVTEKFGRSVDVGYALAALKLIRELNAPPPVIPSKELPVAPPTPAPVTQKPTASAEDSRRLVRWTIGKEKVRAEDLVKDAELNAFITKLVGEGIAPNSIEVWKPVPKKIKVQIDFD